MATRRRPMALSLDAERERQHLEFALRFANASASNERQLLGMELFLGASQWPHVSFSAAEIEAWANKREAFYRQHPQLRSDKIKQLRGLRDSFRQRIACIHQNLKAARRDLEQSINDGLARIQRTPYLKDGVLEESIFQIRDGLPVDEMDNPNAVTQAGASFAAGFAYVLALLLDSRRHFGPALRQCALEECTDYFLSLSRGGGPKPKYCSLACTKDADNHRAATRMAELRAGQKARRHK